MLLEKLIVAASAVLWGVRASPRTIAPPMIDVSRPDPVLPRPAIPEVKPMAEAERRAAVRRRMEPKLVVTPARAVEILVEHCNSYGIHGLFTAAEIDEYWAWCQAERGLSRTIPSVIRKAMDGRRLKVGKVRILEGREFGALRDRFPEAERLTLYRIPRVDIEAATGPDVAGVSRSEPHSNRLIRGASGANPGSEAGSDHSGDRRRAAC